jgi:hypothetical protein
MRLDTNVVDVLISTSATAPVLPTNYTKKRRIGSIKTDASAHILGFSQLGDQFLWTTQPTTWDPGNSNLGIAAAPGGPLIVLTPLGVRTIAITNNVLGTANQMNISSPESPHVAAPWNLGTTGTTFVSSQFHTRTDTNSYIWTTAAVAFASGFYSATVGWIDNRGK